MRTMDQETKTEEGKQRAYRVIGTTPIRFDGVDKVTGRALYGADIRLPGMLYGAVLRSPHAHARIRSIDTRQAEALPEVKAVVTAADLPDLEDKMAAVGEASVVNLRYQSNNVLARDKVLYHGHAIAAVAATNPHIAEEALALIKVEYEVLPPVLDVREAMREDAPILLEDLRTEELGHKGDRPTNVAKHLRHQRGDLEKGFQEAAVIVEREFFTATVHQGYIEPQNVVALYNTDGQVTIWCSTQGAFGVRDQVSEILQIPVSRIRVIPTEIGGGFGGKNSVYLEPVAVLLSKKSGYRPVKLVMSHREVLAATGPTAASYIRVKMGADRNGRITAAEAYLAYAAGAFPGSPVDAAMTIIFGPYRIENLRIDGYDVVVNRPKTSAYRAPGATNAAFACETVVDELCEKLGMDPIEFRLLNGVREGDRRADGPAYPRIGYLETLQAARAHPHYTAPLEGPHRGRGVASGCWLNYGGKSSASAHVNADGTVTLVMGSVDIGGGTRTAIAMQLAETLDIPLEDIKPRMADTDSVGYTEGTYGSRTTFATGWVAYELGQSLKRQLIERAAQLWEVSPDQVTYVDGVFSANGERLTFKELAARLDETDGPVVASAAIHARREGPAFTTHIVDVEVDPETGKVQILRYTAVQDVGTAIHPTLVEGQIQGAAAQGIGWGLNEEYVYDEEGHLVNASFLDYRIPTCMDLPMIDTVLVEVPNPNHPYGVRGVGEVSIVPPPAAIANAIYRAVGVRLNVLPMSPARILEALWQRGQT
ncbi:MAG: xanthine dehydrogenase family protein molybdopterin-binding subunit [Anaerolineae bacterium]|nr:xanthine dehydrogenase family protein molybdopterin-binding subunit [Anaerolineae bacterium]MDW8100459.1 xanthine dehydrogenase family protein molybdopterin-binding subunit [Anaerolineae bacterium]